MLLGALVTSATAVAPNHQVASDEQTVAKLDSQYQAAVKNNDATTMDRILAADFVVVSGSGKAYTKSDLLRMARTRRVQYEHQEDTQRTVRVWGSTAVVTAKLWAKGTDQGQPFDYFVWFSDTYARTSAGWRYVHGQASLHLTESDSGK
jgi:ketosteroid isomerase-like protein